ncbi:MAG: acetyl-CoA carboxylase biotin carboxyl carrier protein subunit [Cyclonatronaceae bacterium]
MKYEAKLKDATWPVELNNDNKSALVNGKTLDYDIEQIGADRWLLRTGVQTYTLSNLTRNGTDLEFTLNGQWVTINVRDEKELLLEKMGFRVGTTGGGGQLKAPMPGKILKVLVNSGGEVKAGDPVIILEAIKMENELKSPVDGTLIAIHVDEGQSVEKNELLLEIETIG